MIDERVWPVAAPPPPVSWCCSYCGALLEPRGLGLFCPAESRWFVTQGAVYLPPAERRQQIQPFRSCISVRRDGMARGARLSEVPAHHPHAGIWRRARHFRRGMALLRAAGARPWNAGGGAGCCWAGVRLARVTR
jgi:hypothetical protein